MLLFSLGCRDSESTSPPEISLDIVARDGATEADGSDRSGRISIATFNVYRLFDTTCDSDDCGGYERVPTEQTYRRRLEGIATGLEKVGADIVCLQEVEKEEVLRDLNAALSDPYPTVVFGESGRPASLDVGILSRGTKRSVSTYRDEQLHLPDGSTDTFVREFLRLDVRIRGKAVSVFTGHFKSQSNDRPGLRLAEAKKARHIVAGLADRHNDRLVALAGDLNAEPGSSAFEALTRDGGLVALGVLESLGSYYYRGRKELIDHIMVAPESEDLYLRGSIQSHWGQNSRGFAGSDHALISAGFKVAQ